MAASAKLWSDRTTTLALVVQHRPHWLADMPESSRSEAVTSTATQNDLLCFVSVASDARIRVQTAGMKGKSGFVGEKLNGQK